MHSIHRNIMALPQEPNELSNGSINEMHFKCGKCTIYDESIPQPVFKLFLARCTVERNHLSLELPFDLVIQDLSAKRRQNSTKHPTTCRDRKENPYLNMTRNVSWAFHILNYTGFPVHRKQLRLLTSAMCMWSLEV